jgi:UDP-N-acetylmuramate--alanine ligase
LKIHFIGIGGIGLSALGRFLAHYGHTVSGSDVMDTTITNKLRLDNVDVTIPHNKDAITDQDLVVYSAVIKPDNVELEAAKAKGIKILPRRDALASILADKKVYSVCGAHGKSTTTAILAAILQSSAIIGAESKEFGSNMRFVEGNLVAFEADESDGSFLNSNPYCAVVTNAEPEHMEYYKYDFEKFYASYHKFLELAKIRVINAEDPYLSTVLLDCVRLFPSKDITNLRYDVVDGEPTTFFNLKDLGEFKVWGFGYHIAVDASLAILAALHEMDIETIRKNIASFKGIKKRFDIVRQEPNFTLIDDYGHHPTEIEATLQSARLFARLNGLSSVTAIWQPHKYSRTVDNLERFVACFEGVDRLIILPVWSAGEKEVALDFQALFAKYNPIMAKDFNEAKKMTELDSGLVIGFGAGDITYQLRESCH